MDALSQKGQNTLNWWGIPKCYEKITKANKEAESTAKNTLMATPGPVPLPGSKFSVSQPVPIQKLQIQPWIPEELAQAEQIMETLDHVILFGQGIVSRLTKLDAANLVWLLAIVLGYVLKFVSIFPNKFIPVASFAFTVSSYVVMTAQPGQPLREFWISLVLGILFWGFAWGLHKAILSKHIDKKLFDEDERPDEATKP